MKALGVNLNSKTLVRVDNGRLLKVIRVSDLPVHLASLSPPDALHRIKHLEELV